MPLFGKHKHDNTAAHEASDEPQHNPNIATSQPQRATGVGESYGANHPAQRGLNQPDSHQPYNTGANTGTTGYPQDQPISGNRAGVGAGANAAGTGTGTSTGPGVSHAHTSAGTSCSGGGGHRREGKAERAVGSLVGSQALKERGVQKEQEAGAFKMQSVEIAEAERLEKEALMHRERAVAHGAHTDNRHLGGMPKASTLDDVTSNQTASGRQADAGGY